MSQPGPEQEPAQLESPSNDDVSTVSRDLAAWHEELYSDATNGAVCQAYLFSPEWDALIGPRLQAYDALLRRQQATGAPRLAWQDDEETTLRETAQLRRGNLKPLSEGVLPRCPIWLHLAKYQGLELSDTSRRALGWNSLLEDWGEVRRLMREDQAFLESLSPAHKRSILVLESWWESEYCDPLLMRVTVEHLERRRPDKSLKNPLFPSDWLAHVAETQIDSSLYHAHLYQLFLHEMHSKCWEPNIHIVTLTILETARYNACVIAVVQKLSYASLHPGPEEKPTSYPVVVQGESTHQFLKSTRQPARRPYYLWDVDARQTVRVSDFPECPEYVCVSHTWGRWRPNPRTSAAVPGVPWPVPENTLYDVRDLPDQLKRIGGRFVWIDLFCIPQDRSDLAAREIANQASIFMGSSYCIAWLHDVAGWEGVHRVLDWISLRSLTVTSRRHGAIVAEREPAAAAAAAGMPAELYKTRAAASTIAAVEPSAWFSSLWTLQESVLCPDMALYTRGWVRLEDRRGTPISLRNLMVFLESTMAHCWMREPLEMTMADPLAYKMAIARQPRKKTEDLPDAWDYPASVRDTFLFSHMTRLARTLTTGLPSNVFINADIRTCTSDRAPAIMSALGVTDWYLPSMSEKDPQPLVFGKYPLAFLREAVLKMGAKFYDFCSSQLTRIETAGDQQEDEEPPAATMLPISDKTGWYNGINGGSEGYNMDMQDHESVATWTINQTGSVSMSRAGIMLKSMEEVRDRPSLGRISAVVSHVTTEKDENGVPRSGSTRTGDMLGVLKRLSRGGRTIYAVALYRDAGEVNGLLFEALGSAQSGGETLRKIGRFMAWCDWLPPSTDVSWTVY